jgi:hypothetical protein
MGLTCRSEASNYGRTAIDVAKTKDVAMKLSHKGTAALDATQTKSVAMSVAMNLSHRVTLENAAIEGDSATLIEKKHKIAAMQET